MFDIVCYTKDGRAVYEHEYKAMENLNYQISHIKEMTRQEVIRVLEFLSMDDLKKEIADEIMTDSKEILTSGLHGISAPQAAFDLGKINYVIDQDELTYRLQRITDGIVNLAISAALPRLEATIEKRIREKIRNKI
jgi:hypothetical protein